MAEIVEVVNAYIMPFEIFQNGEDMKLHLEGLVLLLTYSQQGQFWRLGLFRVDDWEYGDDLAIKPETTCDDNDLSREMSPQNEDVSVDRCRACRGFVLSCSS